MKTFEYLDVQDNTKVKRDNTEVYRIIDCTYVHRETIEY